MVLGVPQNLLRNTQILIFANNPDHEYPWIACDLPEKIWIWVFHWRLLTRSAGKSTARITSWARWWSFKVGTLPVICHASLRFCQAQMVYLLSNMVDCVPASGWTKTVSSTSLFAGEFTKCLKWVRGCFQQTKNLPGHVWMLMLVQFPQLMSMSFVPSVFQKASAKQGFIEN